MASEAAPRISGCIDIEGRTTLIMEWTTSPMSWPAFFGEADATILCDFKNADITYNSVNNILSDHITNISPAKIDCNQLNWKYYTILRIILAISWLTKNLSLLSKVILRSSIRYVRASLYLPPPIVPFTLNLFVWPVSKLHISISHFLGFLKLVHFEFSMKKS